MRRLRLRRLPALTGAVLVLSVGFSLLQPVDPSVPVLGAEPAVAVDPAMVAGTGPARAATPLPGLPRRPNVVLITADDMRKDDLRFMPYTRGEFRRRGVTFSDAISPYPLCCPARAQIVTGQYNHTNGVRGNEWPNGGYYALRHRRNTLPVWLRRNGYLTGFVGKYMNQYGTDPARLRDPEGRLRGRRQFEVPAGWSHWYGAARDVYAYNRVGMNIDTPQTKPRRTMVRRYQTGYYSDVTTELIRGYHRAQRPFFIWASHLAPHTAFGPVPPVPAPRDRGVHRALGLPQRADYRAAFNAPPTGKLGPMRARRPVNIRAVLRHHRARAESLRSLDRAVEAAVTELKRTGEYDRTVLIFTSDNGYALGEHRHVGKDVPYEPALRVPMIVNAPEVKSRYAPRARRRTTVTVPHAVTTTDIASTIAGVTHTPPGRLLDGLDMTRPRENPDHRAGRDRVVLIESGSRSSRPSATSRFVGVRTSGWTWFVWNFAPTAGGAPGSAAALSAELYDRRRDPAQNVNLAGGTDPATTGTETALRQLAEEMHDCRGGECVRGVPLG